MSLKHEEPEEIWAVDEHYLEEVIDESEWDNEYEIIGYDADELQDQAEENILEAEARARELEQELRELEQEMKELRQQLREREDLIERLKDQLTEKAP